MSYTVRFGFTLDVHETLLTSTVDTAFVFFEDLVEFYFYIYNCTVPCIVEFTGHLLSDDTTSITEIGGNGNN